MYRLFGIPMLVPRSEPTTPAPAVPRYSRPKTRAPLVRLAGVGDQGLAARHDDRGAGAVQGPERDALQKGTYRLSKPPASMVLRFSASVI